MKLVPAGAFSLEALTDAYNRTRTDYLIPMPMSPGRFNEYITLYDVDLSCSRVAVDGGHIIGLAMLGLRAQCAWITRLGVLPEGRRHGVARALVEALLEQAADSDAPEVWLEVIKGNEPAHSLFLRYGFEPTRELLVARRAPRTARNTAALLAARRIDYLQHEEVIELHCVRGERMNWLNAVETMGNVRRLVASPGDDKEPFPLHHTTHLSGILVEFQDGSRGWVSYQATTLELKRISVTVVRGAPATVTANLLAIMHRLHAAQDAIVENIPDDERWRGFRDAGYFEVFRRIEMVRPAEAVAPARSVDII